MSKLKELKETMNQPVWKSLVTDDVMTYKDNLQLIILGLIGAGTVCAALTYAVYYGFQLTLAIFGVASDKLKNNKAEENSGKEKESK